LDGLIKAALSRRRLTEPETSIPSVSLSVLDKRPEIGFCCDFSRCVQTTMNFVANSLKYGGKSVKVNVTLESHSPDAAIQKGASLRDQCIVFEVEDCGKGVGENFWNLLFESFQTQKEQKSTQGRSSLGLGLSLCKLNAIQMGGCVGYRPVEGKGGSIFFLAIPYVPYEQPVKKPQDTSSLKKAQSVDNGFLHVLVIDDTPINRKIVEKMLRDTNYSIQVAANKDEALQMLQSKPPDFVLMDYQLGEGVTGIEVWQEIKKLVPRKLPRFGALVLSAYPLKDRYEELKGAGFSGYLSKPFSKEQLLHTLRDVASGKQCW